MIDADNYIEKETYQDILVICPSCNAKKELKFPTKIINQAKQLTTVSIPLGAVCEHGFQAFIDKNFIVRGYQKVDFEFSHMEYFECSDSDIKESNDMLGWYGQIDGTSRDFRFTNTNIPTNSWSHITVTYANDGQHAIRAYVDGQLQDSITTYSGPLSTSTTNLVLGNRINLGRPLDGLLDEVRISNIDRSASWIKTCYNNQNNPTSFINLE